MDRNAHYLIVGLFVIAATIAGILFAGWLYNDSNHHAMRHYEVHFSESVEGLNAGNEVRYMGVKVGQVESTNLLPKQPDKVGVTIRIDESTPITTQTVAVLRTQGVTGLSYINLVTRKQAGAATEREHADPSLPINPQTGLPVIQSSPSEFGGLIQALPRLQADLNTLLGNANQALNQQNLQNFSATLENINKLSARANKVFSDENITNLSAFLENLQEATKAAPQLVSDLRKTTSRLNHLVNSMDQLVSNNQDNVKKSMLELQRTLRNISTMTQHYTQLAEQLKHMAATNETSVNELIATGGADVKALLNESRRTATAIRRLSEKLEQNPSQIIYESKPQGVEIPY